MTTEEPTKLSFKQKAQLKTLSWAQKIAVRKAKKDIGKLYQKHQTMIDVLIANCEELVLQEKEEVHPQMVAIICANLIAPFDKVEQRRLVVEMVQKTLEGYEVETGKQ